MFYAVKKGRVPGIYTDQEEAVHQVYGFKDADMREFINEVDAINYVNLKLDNNGAIRVYTKGSYSSKTSSCGFGSVITKDNIIVKEIKGSLRTINHSRNVTGELEAIIESINYICSSSILTKENNEICIYVDYSGFTKWLTGEWKTNKTIGIRFKEYIELLKNQSHLNVNIIKSTASVNSSRANQLAKEAVSTSIEEIF